jgi:hypothetical protein
MGSSNAMMLTTPMPCALAPMHGAASATASVNAVAVKDSSWNANANANG